MQVSQSNASPSSASAIPEGYQRQNTARQIQTQQRVKLEWLKKSDKQESISFSPSLSQPESISNSFSIVKFKQT
jgi:hypothetical protein